MSKEVTAAIWRWKEAGITPAAKTHSKPALRAVIQAAVVAGIGCLFLWREHNGMAIFPLALGAFLFISGLFIPWLFLDFEKFGKKIGQWVGAALTWLLLVPMFFIVFFPGRLILWLTRRDPMGRQFPSGEETYWVPRRPVGKIEQYTRQY